MNNLNLVGRIVKDTELSYIPGSGIPVTKFNIAVERKFQKDRNNKKVDFIPCEFIGKQCEKMAQYLIKGAMINVIGEIHIDEYTKKDNTKGYFTKMHVENLRILDFNIKSKGLEPTGFQSITDSDIPF